MKTLVLLAVVGFVLSVGFALPFSDNEGQNDELKDIAADFEDDFEPENRKSDNGIETEDEDEQFDEEDFNDEDSDLDEDEFADDDEDEITDDNDEDETNEDEGTAVEKSSDPKIRFRRIARGIKRVGRKVARKTFQESSSARSSNFRLTNENLAVPVVFKEIRSKGRELHIYMCYANCRLKYNCTTQS
ncbi:hypothetical protein ACROYT_G024831 [Oculina patagonica]